MHIQLFWKWRPLVTRNRRPIALRTDVVRDLLKGLHEYKTRWVSIGSPNAFHIRLDAVLKLLLRHGRCRLLYPAAPVKRGSVDAIEAISFAAAGLPGRYIVIEEAIHGQQLGRKSPATN